MDGTIDAAGRVASYVGAHRSGRGEVHELLRNVHEPVATMSRAEILISVGSGAVVLGVTLLAWVNDSARPSVIPEVLGLLLLVPGMLLLQRRQSC